MRQSELAYVRLREDILTWVAKPGQPLSELETASRLGISRTPVREAMHRLARENLVRIVPGRGAFVAHISVADVVELFQMREALEPAMARLAASKPDNAAIAELLDRFKDAASMIESGDVAGYQDLCSDMDQEISRMAGNSRMQTVLRTVWQEARRVRGIARSNQSRLLETVDEHTEILRLIDAGDGDGAYAATARHLSRSFDNTMQSLRDVTGPS